MNTNIPLILKLDIAGNPDKWITYESAAYYHAKDLIAWGLGQEEHFTIHGGTSRMTGNQSTLDIDPIIAVKGHPGKNARRTVPLTNKALFRRDKNICAYCGNPFPDRKLTRDHIIPTSKGGKNIWQNVVACCSPCNKHKDNKSVEQANMTLLFVPYVPCKNEFLILMNKNILANQMEFLMSQVPKHSRLHNN